MFIFKLIIVLFKLLFKLIANIFKFVFGTIFLGINGLKKTCAGAEDFARQQYVKTKEYAENIKFKAEEELKKQM